MGEAEHPLLRPALPQNTEEQHQDQESIAECLLRRTCLESKKIWQIAGPSIFSRLAMFSMTVITQSFAGHLGDLYLAAISIACTFFISISFGFLLGMASALETLCGQAYGAKQYHMLGIYMQRSWIVLFLSSILLLPMFIFATPILKFLGQPNGVAEQTGLVAIWLIPFHLSFPFQFTLQRFLQSQLKTAVVAWVSGIALAIHALVSWFFVHKMEVGIVGTALTLDFSWWVSVVGLFGYVVFGGCPQSWKGFSGEAFVGLWEFFKLSVASGVMLSLENFYYRLLAMMSGYMHNSEIAIDALSVCVTIYGWESMIPLGFLAATGYVTGCVLESFRDFYSFSAINIVSLEFTSNFMKVDLDSCDPYMHSLGETGELCFCSIYEVAFANSGITLSSLFLCQGKDETNDYRSKGFFFLATQKVRVSNELGTGNPKGAKFATLVSVVNTVVVGFIIWLIIMVFNEKLALIFSTSLSVIRMVNELAILLAFTILLNCIQPVLSGVAVGCGRQPLVAYINIGSYYLVGIPLGIVLGRLLPWGLIGIWTGMLSGTIVQTLILAVITTRCDWEKEAQKARIFLSNEAALIQ